MVASRHHLGFNGSIIDLFWLTGGDVTELNFKGKEFVYNHHLAVPFRPLVPHPEKGIGPVAFDGNLIIHVRQFRVGHNCSGRNAGAGEGQWGIGRMHPDPDERMAGQVAELFVRWQYRVVSPFSHAVAPRWRPGACYSKRA